MSYLMTHFWPEGTEDQYRATLAVAHPGGVLPAGQTHHVAGPTDGGFLVSVVWDSKESADAFVSDTLMAAMPIEGGLVGPPQERTADVVNAVSA